MDFLAVFYAPMKLVLAWPAAPFLLAAVFGAMQVLLLMSGRNRPAMILWRRPALFAAAIWGVYGLYELQVQATMPAANIRIDLLVLAPILYVFTAVAVWWIVREWRGSDAPPPAHPDEPASSGGSDSDKL